MQHSIRTITESLLQRLHDEQLHYTPSELEKAGFPVFLVNRIRLELERNLAESVTLPDSDWADMQTDSVQDAWDNFLKAIRAETRIPHSFLQSVTENAVEDTLELLAEPERMVLETLFRSNEKAKLVELMARRNWVTINEHLADALIRYLSKRNLSEISKEKAANILRQIDVHIAAGYTPLKWGQALDTWFTLFGSTVPSNMVARFFADKGMDSLSKRFSQADEYLSRSQLIEYLSMPDFGWTDEDDDDANISTNTTVADVASASTPNDAVESTEQTLETESGLSTKEGPSDKSQTFEKVEILEIENYITKKGASDENVDETGSTDQETILTKTVSHGEEGLPDEPSLHEQLSAEPNIDALDEIISKDSEITSPGGGTDDDWIKILSEDTPVSSNKSEETEDEDHAFENNAIDKVEVDSDENLDALFISSGESVQLDEDELEDDEFDDGTGIDDIYEIEDDPNLDEDESEIDDDPNLDEDELENDELDDGTGIDDIYEIEDDPDLDEDELENDELDDGTGIDDIYEIEDDPDLDEDELEDDVIASKNDSNDSEEVPIWQRFLSPEDGREDSDDETPTRKGSLLSNLSEDPNDDESKSFADSFLSLEDDEESPSDLNITQQETEEDVTDGDANEIAPLSLNSEDDEHENDDHVIYLTDDAKALLEQLSPEKDGYIEELFRNDEVAFYTQLNEIVQFDTWQNAGRYVMREIYTKNRVDMYSDVAVAFTDTVQQYFEVKSLSN